METANTLQSQKKEKSIASLRSSPYKCWLLPSVLRLQFLLATAIAKESEINVTLFKGLSNGFMILTILYPIKDSQRI